MLLLLYYHVHCDCSMFISYKASLLIRIAPHNAHIDLAGLSITKSTCTGARIWFMMTNIFMSQVATTYNYMYKWRSIKLLIGLLNQLRLEPSLVIKGPIDQTWECGMLQEVAHISYYLCVSYHPCWHFSWS